MAINLDKARALKASIDNGSAGKKKTGGIDQNKASQLYRSVIAPKLPDLKLQELPELTAAPSQYATWTGKKGGVDARGIDLEAGAADLEMRGQSLDVLNDYLEAAGVNLDRLERRASLTGAAEDVSAYESAFETYKAAAERARGEAANYDRLAGIYNAEARLKGMTAADMRAQIQENVRRLEKEADPEKIRTLQRSNENMRRRMEEIESQPTVEERLEEAYAREDELQRQVAAAERGLRRSGDVTELRRLQGELGYVQNQITELGGTADASWLKGAGQRYFGSMQEAIGILVKGEDNRQQESNIRAGEEALAEALEAAVMAEAAGRGDPAETARLRGLVDAIGQTGADKEKLLAEFLPGAAEVTEEVEKRNELAEAGRQAMQEEGADLTAKGEGNIEAAKGGRSAIEKTLIDIGVQGVNMALDAAIGNVTMLGGNVPLALRSFGGAAGQAVQEGASDAGAIGYGAASAAAEVLFGKLLDGAAGIYGKGAADDFVDHLVGKIAKTETGRKAWQLLFASAGEGAEEVLTDLVDPALRLIYSGDSLGESYSKLEGADVAYDFMIGAIMGFFGGGIDAVSEPTASTQFFYDAAQNGMSFPQAVNAWKTLSADILKTETDRARELAKFDAEADRIVAQQVRGEQQRKAEAEAKEAEKSYFERLTTRSQANKIVNDEALKAEWQQKTGVALEGAKGDQARTVMAESQKRLDTMNAEAATVSKTEEVGEPNAEKVVVAENATATETAETAQEAPQTQTATEMPVQGKAPTEARTAQEGRNDAKSAQQTIEILRGRDTDTAQYGGVEYSVYYDVDGTYTARAMRGDETLWTRSGLKNRTEAVNVMQSAREAGEIAGAGTGGAPGLVRNETYEKLRSNKNITSRTVRELDYLARVIGSEIAIEETVTDSEGVSVNAKYSNGRITVAMDADDPLTVAVVHEAVHSIKESDEAAFKDLAGAVFGILANESDSFAQDFQNKARQYGWLDENGAYTENGEADTLEELVAQGMGIVAQNSDVLSRVTAQERGVIQRVLDAIHDLVEKIRGYTDYDADKGISREDVETYKTLLNHMEELQGKLEAALTDKSDSIEAKAVEMVGPETETERTPVSREEEAKYSTKRDEPLMDDADKYNDERGSVAKAVMEKAREQREFVKGLLSNESIQAMLPEDVEGNTVYSNSSYAKSAENSTVCPRSLVLDELANAVSTALGRPLSFNEALYVTQMSANYTDKPECAYCYVAADRKMYTDMLGRYIQQRNAAVQAHKEGESLEWIIENIIGIKPGDAKRNTDKMKNRVKTWLKMADENKAFISEADLAGFGNFAEDIKKRRESLAPELRAEFDLATKYAQSAARAKLRVKYAAYDGKILKMSPKAVSNLNSMYGLRMYSFTDFSPAFILENMQMFTDAAVKGLKVLAYTKEMEFAEIFASTGANINISVHGMKSPDAQGEFHMDAMQGADWERARALREQHPNVGITFVAESDAAVEWAMRQDWIDVVIPFHSVFGGGNLAAEIYGWKNYKQFQEDKKDSSLWKKGNAKSIYPAEHNNDLITYADALIKNGLTPRFPQWCNGFERYRAGEIDADTFRLLNPNYMKLVNECRRSAKDTPAVQPIFDTSIAEEAIDTMVKRGGFYEQIGGSSENMQEIAGEIAGEIRQGKAEEMAANKRLEKWSRKAVTPEEPVIRPIASEYLGDSDYAVIKYLGASVSLKQNKRGEWVGMFMGGGHNGNVIAETREAALEALDAKMSEAYASAYEAPTDADRAEQAAWEGRETDLETGSVTENRSLSRAEAEEIAEREGYPMLEDADGNERQAVPEYTWVQSRERGNYGLVTGMEIVDGVPMLNVWFENKARGTGMSVAMRPDEVIAVEGEMQTGRPEYTDEDAPPEADNTPPTDMWLPSEEEYKRQRELQESREETKREYQRMTADELTQQIIDQTPRQQRPESGVDISEIDVKEKQRKDAERIRLRRERAARTADRSAFTGTDEMKAAGIKVSGSLVRNWTNIQNLMQRNQAEKSINREYGKMLKKYNLRPSSPEVQFARGLANGTYTEADIPKRFNAGIVRDIANVERARSQMKAETLREVKSDLNYREQEKAAVIFADSEKYRATPHGKVTKNFMNERTPERVLRSIYGAEKGAQIFNYLFRPVQENNAEAIRWVNKQKEDVSMRFVDSKNVQRDLTKAEKAYAQHIREGEGFAWQAAELEGYDLETYDAHMANFKELMELMKRDGYSDVIELVDAVNRGDMDRSEAEDRSANPELFREVLANRQAAVSLPEMDSDLRKIVEGMQWYRQIEEEIKNNKEVDAVIIDNAADAIGEKYDDYYKIINQFLVAHGHDEIGFIPGYAPHMQPEPQRKAWGKALATLGIQLDEVSSLPAAIAGRTADFKPNMRWNPHFQHRLGGETDYNIVKGFESYLKFMSDIIYHTDDIMRLRQVVNYFRTTYGSEEIAANLSAANAIRNASLEEKVNFLHGHTPEGYTPMFMSEANELIDRYVESQYADAENLSKYSEFVTWLENYANLLAGKQSLADRGLEYSGGRLLLNVSRKVMNAFMRANVAGSASSVLNQTAQLPMITTHLGPKYGYQAIRDILTGEVKKADWKNRSDFLTGKKGVDMLEMSDSKLDSFVDKLFTPAQMMDDIISTIAVRGEYLRQIDQGVSDEIALRRADDYARRVMGSRVKGEKPQGFESKRLFAQMAHVFQVEAANQFDYVTSDMPQAIRDIVEREGKVKAAKKVAAVATGYLLQAFLLNRLGEELYGGTPAPFDLIGMAAEFSAAGRDMSTERWLMQLVDNVMENHLGGERVFGTSEDEGAEEFDWANAMEASAYTISNDLPFIRNIAGIMGLGDESLPTVGINEVWQGAKGLWSGAKGDDGRFGGGDADWREIGESALDIAAQIAPGGRQLKKTATGLGTMIEGGSYSGNKLRYPVDGSAGKWVQALLFGTSALDETDEYYATNARNLSEKQTFVYKALVADGMQRQDAYEALQRYRELDGDKTLTAAEKANAKRDFITALPISDEAKLETWLDLVLDGEESSKYKTARELMDMGVQWMHVAAALNAQKSIDEGDGTAGAKATEFAKWVDDYAADHWLKEQAVDLMKDGLAFWSMVKQEAGTYEKLTDSGLTSAQAQDIYSLWANLKPDEGKKSVSEIQKMYALGAAKGLTDAQRYDATAGTLIDDTSLETESGNPSQYAKMLWCRDEGMSYADYVDAKDAGAIDNIYRFGTEAGADAESAYTMAMAVAALKPAPGKDEVSQGQKFEAIGKADVEDVYKMAVMEEWLEETTFKKLELAMGHGVSIELYGKAKQMLPKFDADGNGSYKQAEVENALRSMDISEKERAALWQAITNGKRNPFDRSVGTEMYKAYNAWNASRKK